MAPPEECMTLRQLPRSIRPLSQKKISQFLKEESFDCFKKEISNNSGIAKEIGVSTKIFRSKGSKRKKKRRHKSKREIRRYQKRIPTQYRPYIKSHWWTDRKNAYYKKFGRRCAACDGTNRINLHHLRYGSYGREKDEHLVPLCHEHHEAFHAQYGTSADMIRDTLTFIDETRQLLEFPRLS
jgi:hypothetical protein